MPSRTLLLLVGAIAVSAAGEPPSLATALEAALRCERPEAPDDIVVCAAPPEDLRYRLPAGTPPEPGDPAATSVSRERNALVERGADGLMSCSTVGPGGEHGCVARAMKRAAEQHNGRPR